MAETKTQTREALIDELERDPDTRISACYQCQKCATGCPIGFASDLLPSQIIQMIRLGCEREVLTSRAIWLCVTCSACTARCPMGIDLAKVMDALRRRAKAEGMAPDKTPEAIFNEEFLKSVRRHGRVFEMGMLTRFKLRSGEWMRDLDKFPGMLVKGKIALLPQRGSDRAAVRNVFDRAAKKKK
jgi:heterodisulfide reductase subunit C